MSIPQNSPGSGGRDNGDESRVRCLYCGANNFDTSPTCWQCSRPLQPMRQAPQPQSPPYAGSAFASPSVTPTPASYARPATAINTGLATKSAALLGLMFPFIGLPVGMVFLMLDDARKTQIGWITIGWSIAGSILNTIILAALLGPTLAALKSFIPHAAPGGLPTLPSMGGDGSGLNLLTPVIFAFGHRLL